jgi:transglutaminase-like putative cysteine protease
VGIAVAAGAALILLRAPREASRPALIGTALARIVALAALVVIAALAAGLPAHLLRPAGWGRLLRDVHGGLQKTTVTLWPYVGTDTWARLDILLPLAALPVLAAAVGFWPAARRGAAAASRFGVRQLVALALVLSLYVFGALESNGGAPTIEGLLLLALIVAWLWLPGVRRHRLPATLVWLAATGVLAAALVAPLGGDQAWLNYRAWNLVAVPARGLSFSWDQSYGPIAWSRAQRQMFTVSAPAAQLWKTTTLDRFDGLRFMRSGTDATSYEDLPIPVNTSWYTFARFTIKGLGQRLLPTEQGTTVGVDLGGPVNHDRDGTTRTAAPALESGDAYTVLAYVPRPSPAELRAAPRAFPSQYLRYTDFDLPAAGQSGLRLAATDPPIRGRFFDSRTVGARAPGLTPAASGAIQTRVLRSPYGPMYRLARHLAAGRRSSYDVAIAIERYLAANYIYGEQPPARRYPLESFLFADRIGYCQQFSGAMALMLRMDGIPARVAGGFLPGSRTAGRFVVRAVDAHSWVEVYFSGIGWVAFNPTPPRSVGHALRFPLYTSERTVYPYAALAATVGGLPQRAEPRLPALHRRRVRGASGWSLVLWIAAILGGLGLLALGARWLAGYVRLRRSLERDGDLATQELAVALRRLGYSIPACVTLAALESVVHLHGGPDAVRYVRLLRDRRYAAGSTRSASLRDRRVLRARLTAPLGLDARLRGLWVLPPATVGWGVVARAHDGHTGGP